MKLWLLIGVTAVIQVGCQTIAAPNAPATVQAENQQIIAEATQIAQDARRDHERVVGTAAAVMTDVAELQGANQVLLATVRAGDPPEQRVVVGTDNRGGEGTPGQRLFELTGVSQFINDADGCVVAPQVSFPADIPIIYATMRAFNIESGIQFSAVWEREGIETFRDSFVYPNSETEVCIWFSVDTSEAELLPGNWAVRLFADGTQVGTPIVFAVEESDAMMEEEG